MSDDGIDGGPARPGPFDGDPLDDEEFGGDVLEEELRQAAVVLDPVPPQLRQLAVDAFALHDLDARIAELTFDSLVDAIPVRGAADVPRMLTFTAGEVTVDVEVTGEGLIGQVLPPGPARIEVLGGPRTTVPLTADDMGRFAGDVRPAGPFALRVRTGGETVVTEWLRA
ncbi:hypothetical protein [Streptomyces sp. DH24]|uniref:hypothetical protein n=1 Tax=Streptomyces sp. DH24 TaxID=3040123 RepID=UPI00244357A9|nr:hypothetical protein [Streptomyces sp. DH24]MDG9719004.1 hypothetical protein [Streptomyces sp. DH24]